MKKVLNSLLSLSIFLHLKLLVKNLLKIQVLETVNLKLIKKEKLDGKKNLNLLILTPGLEKIKKVETKTEST